MQTSWRLAKFSGGAGVILATLMFLSGCGGNGGDTFFGSDAEDDLGDLFMTLFPSEDSAGVFRDSRLEFNFNGPLAVDSVKSSTIRVFLDGDNDATSVPNCDPADGDEPGEWVPGQFFVGLSQVTFVPSDTFLANRVYCVVIPSRQEAALAQMMGNPIPPLISNVQGNTMVNQYSAFFITSSGFTFSNEIDLVTPGTPNSPGTLGVDPNTCIDVTHSRPIDTSSVNPGTFQVIDMSTCAAVTGTFTFPSPMTIRFCPDMPLTDATIHEVIVTSGIEDTAGIGSNGGNFFFTTAFPTPDGSTGFTEDFVDIFLEEVDPAELPPMIDVADWNGNQMTPAGQPGRLAATVGPFLPVGGQGTADLMIVTGTFHEIDTDAGTIDGGPPPSAGGVPAFMGDGTFAFNDITLGGAVTLEAFGSVPLVLMASGAIAIDGTIDIHGDEGGSAIAGPSSSGGSPSSERRAGGTSGGQGAPSNGQAGLNGIAGFGHTFPLPAMVGEGAGCGGETFIDPMAGEIGAGGGGGGFIFAGFNGFTSINGLRTWPQGFGTLGQHDLSYGGLPIQQNVNLDPLYAGSGGGGGASITDSPGGAGGNGAGAMRLVAAGLITLNGGIIANGGRGGNVLPDATMSPGLSGGGGGGSGGAIHAISATEVQFNTGSIDVTGGLGGTVPPPFYIIGGLGGGHGIFGRLFGEAPPNPLTGQPLVFLPGPGPLQPTMTPPLEVNPLNGILPNQGRPITINPPGGCLNYAPTSNFPNTVNQTAAYCGTRVLPATMFFQANASVDQSRWFRITDNGIPVGVPGAGVPVINPNFSGAAFTTANVPSGGTAIVEWQGAEEGAPGMPKAGTRTPWTTNIDILDTHELIRFRVSLTNITLPDTGGPPPAAAVLDVSVNYSFNL